MKRNLFFSGMLILLLALGFVACDNNSGGGGDNGDINIVGFWDSIIIDGDESFPVSIQFNQNGTFAITVSVEGQTIPMTNGIYTVSGNTINFTMQDSSTAEGNIDGNSSFTTGNLVGAQGDRIYLTFTRR